MSDREAILVVENSREVCAFVRDVLQASGYRVYEAYSGWKALQSAGTSPPDVLLLDWQLPDITGLDVLRALRAGKSRAPAILMTSYGSEELVIEALRLGVIDYLRKPFEAADLQQSVERALTETRLRRETEMLGNQLAQATQRLDDYAWQVTVCKHWLGKLAVLTEALKRATPQNWAAHLQEVRRYIYQIALALEKPPPRPK